MGITGGEGASFRPDLTITRRFQAPTAIPGMTGYGRWDACTWDDGDTIQHGTRLTPSQAPWRELFAALDTAGRTLSPDPVTLLEEADAIAACCWRYGTYIHLLTGGELFPAFRQDWELSRIGDPEMKRINLEFSSGLARDDQSEGAGRTRPAADHLAARRRCRPTRTRLRTIRARVTGAHRANVRIAGLARADAT